MHQLKFNLQTNKAQYPWGPYYNSAIADVTDGLGIPVAQLTSSDTTGDITDAGQWALVTNLYSTDATNGRNAPTGTATSVVFWGLQGADRAWWSSNLKDIQVQNEKNLILTLSGYENFNYATFVIWK